MFPKPTLRRLKNDFIVAATPISAAFCQLWPFHQGEMFIGSTSMSTLSARVTVRQDHAVTSFTSLFASSIPSEGTTLDKEPSGLGRDLRVKVEYFKIPPDILAFTTQNYV